MTSFRKDGRSRSVAAWLIVVALMVLGMVVLGGATRLTGSGLSITQWKPVTGAIPPLSEPAWLQEFARYRATPQYRYVNEGMSLGQFKFIFWWEWAHRLLGRTVAIVFAVPFAWFAYRRTLTPGMMWRCGVLFVLGGLQGAVGWWMVQSGLEARVSVAPERLAAHLGLALLLLAALVLTALEAWFGQARVEARRRDGWSFASALLALGVYLQCLLGALVAGNQAGLVENDWPLMGGRFVPDDYLAHGWWATLAHSRPAVQFNHRMLAYAIAVGAIACAVSAVRSRSVTLPIRILAVAVAFAVVAQASLGVATLMTGVPLGLAIAHQFGAASLLILASAFAWRSRRR